MRIAGCMHQGIPDSATPYPRQWIGLAVKRAAYQWKIENRHKKGPKLRARTRHAGHVGACIFICRHVNMCHLVFIR